MKKKFKNLNCSLHAQKNFIEKQNLTRYAKKQGCITTVQKYEETEKIYWFDITIGLQNKVDITEQNPIKILRNL